MRARRRKRTHLQAAQVPARVDRRPGPAPRAGRPLDLAADRRLRPAAARPRPGRRPAPPLGTATPARAAADALPGPPRISSSARPAGHPGPPAENHPARPRPPARREEHPSPAPPPRIGTSQNGHTEEDGRQEEGLNRKLGDDLRGRGHRARVEFVTDEAIALLAPRIGTRAACAAAGRAAGHLVPAAPDQPAAAEGRRRSRTPSGSSRGRWPRPSGRRSWMRCTATGSLTWPRTKSGRSLLDEGTYLGSVSTYYRVLREAGESRERRASGHSSRRGQARARRRRAEPGLLVGHHQAARPGEVDLLPPVRDLRHLQPLRRRLDGRHPRVRGPGREADRRDLRQAGHHPRPAEHPRRPRLLDDLQAGRAAAGRPGRHPVPLPARTSPTTTRTPRRSSRP